MRPRRLARGRAVARVALVVHVVAAAVFVFRGGGAAPGRRARHRARLCVYNLVTCLSCFLCVRVVRAWFSQPGPRLPGGDRENRSARGPPGGAGFDRDGEDGGKEPDEAAQEGFRSGGLTDLIESSRKKSKQTSVNCRRINTWPLTSDDLPQTVPTPFVSASSLWSRDDTVGPASIPDCTFPRAAAGLFMC